MFFHFKYFRYFCLDRPGLKGILEIQRLNQAIMKALRNELNRTHQHHHTHNHHHHSHHNNNNNNNNNSKTGNNLYHLKDGDDLTVLQIMIAKSASLRELSMLHMEALNKFRRSTPHLIFPALHKELFAIDQEQQLV